MKWLRAFDDVGAWSRRLVDVQRALAITACLIPLGSAVTVGCSGEAQLANAISLDQDAAPSAGNLVLCEPGDSQRCSVTLRQQTDLLSCYQGVKYCQDDGTWGECVEGDEVPDSGLQEQEYHGYARYLPSKGLRALTALTPGDCNDLCDPDCRTLLQPTPGAGASGYQAGQQAVSCGHNVCTVDDDAPLSTGCCTNPSDPNCCITKICAKDAFCCQTGWDQDCVDLMYTECLGRPPPFGLCDFGVYSEQGILTRNRPSSGAAIGSKGNITMGTDANPSMIVAGGNLDIKSPNGKNVNTTGGVWVTGNVTAENGANATYTGSWNVGGYIDLNNGNTVVGKVNARGYVTELNITGDARSGSTFTSVGGTGARVANSNHAAPVIQLPASIPTLPKPPVLANGSCPGGTNYTVDNGVRTLTPGNYGTITMQNAAKLTLDGPGTYTFTVLNANSLNSGGIQIGKTAAGGYTLIVCGAVSVGNNATIINYTGNAANNTDKPVMVDSSRFVMYAGSTVTFGTDGKFVGVLIAPNNKVTVADRTTVKGAIWAKNFESGTDMNAAGISAAACEALNIPGSAPVTNACTITTVIQAPLTIDEYQYEADCPIATTARWKNLTWVTTVPTSSQIEFKAKVAATEAGLASATYTSVGIAKTGSPNTTTCSLSGPSPSCPVALTNKLNLGDHQGQFLALRIERNSTGGMPQIQDWQVSYTCRYSE